MADESQKFRKISDEVDERLARNFGISDKTLKIKTQGPTCLSIRPRFWSK